MARADASAEQLLERARAGDGEALGRLLELYRNDLRARARALIDGTLRARIDPADLVQETFLKAHREFDQFVGGSAPELAAWLRRILVRALADLAKHHRARGRDVRREQSLEQALERSSPAVQRALAGSRAAPDRRAARREQAARLDDALARLPADYHDVFVLREIERVPVDVIAARMGRSANAVRKLWTRALARLRRELESNQ